MNNIITSFHCNITELCKKSFSKQDRSGRIDVLVGVFAIVTALSISHLVKKEVQISHPSLFDFIYHSILIYAYILLTYNVWSPSLKNEAFIAVLRSIIFPYILVLVPTTIVLISNFGQFQVMLLLINIMIFVLLVRWQVALVILPLSTYLSVKACEFYANSTATRIFAEFQIGLKFKIIYTLVLICGIIIAFLKPKQEEQELSEEMVEHLKHQLTDQEAELTRATTLKHEFLKNLQHETNTPLTGMCSMSQALDELYDKLTDKERKRAVSTIAKSSNRLISYVSNLIDVSKLTNALGIEHNIKMRNINISNLADRAVRKCKKLYIPLEEEDSREFIIKIEPNISTTCDEYYISRAFEGIIINAIQYCNKGEISITLARGGADGERGSKDNEKSKIIFSVKDEGIGIPPKDLKSIFEPFMTSTKTKTPAGGRGVGLALVKKVAEMHKGTVAAESNNQSGSLFTISLPVV